MGVRTDIKAIKRRLGMYKRPWVYFLAYGYNDDDEILYDVIVPSGREKSVTEKELHELYPSSHYRVQTKVIGVTDGKGGVMRDEKGRRKIVDWRGV